VTLESVGKYRFQLTKHASKGFVLELVNFSDPHLCGVAFHNDPIGLPEYQQGIMRSFPKDLIAY